MNGPSQLGGYNLPQHWQLRVEEEFETMSWTLSKYGNGGNNAFMPYSKVHVLVPDGDGRTLCGKRIGLHMGHSDSGRCRACYWSAYKKLANA